MTPRERKNAKQRERRANRTPEEVAEARERRRVRAAARKVEIARATEARADILRERLRVVAEARAADVAAAAAEGLPPPAVRPFLRRVNNPRMREAMANARARVENANRNARNALAEAAAGLPVIAPVARVVAPPALLPNFLATEIVEMAERLEMKWCCSICLEDKAPKEFSISGCGHRMCCGCRETFNASYNRGCPECRA